MLIYKVIDDASWQTALAAGHYDGSADDHRDGYVHLSASVQTSGTLAKHFAGRDDLVLAAIEAGLLGAALKWEVSRGGEKFPHLYAPLPTSAVMWWRRLSLGADGVHILPPEFV